MWRESPVPVVVEEQLLTNQAPHELAWNAVVAGIHHAQVGFWLIINVRFYLGMKMGKCADSVHWSPREPRQSAP